MRWFLLIGLIVFDCEILLSAPSSYNLLSDTTQILNHNENTKQKHFKRDIRFFNAIPQQNYLASILQKPYENDEASFWEKYINNLPTPSGWIPALTRAVYDSNYNQGIASVQYVSPNNEQQARVQQINPNLNYNPIQPCDNNILQIINNIPLTTNGQPNVIQSSNNNGGGLSLIPLKSSYYDNDDVDKIQVDDPTLKEALKLADALSHTNLFVNGNQNCLYKKLLSKSSSKENTKPCSKIFNKIDKNENKYKKSNQNKAKVICPNTRKGIPCKCKHCKRQPPKHYFKENEHKMNGFYESVQKLVKLFSEEKLKEIKEENEKRRKEWQDKQAKQSEKNEEKNDKAADFEDDTKETDENVIRNEPEISSTNNQQQIAKEESINKEEHHNIELLTEEKLQEDRISSQDHHEHETDESNHKEVENIENDQTSSNNEKVMENESQRSAKMQHVEPRVEEKEEKPTLTETEPNEKPNPISESVTEEKNQNSDSQVESPNVDDQKPETSSPTSQGMDQNENPKQKNEDKHDQDLDSTELSENSEKATNDQTQLKNESSQDKQKESSADSEISQQTAPEEKNNSPAESTDGEKAENNQTVEQNNESLQPVPDDHQQNSGNQKDDFTVQSEPKEDGQNIRKTETQNQEEQTNKKSQDESKGEISEQMPSLIPENSESLQSEDQQNNSENPEEIQEQMPNLIPEKTESSQSESQQNNSENSEDVKEQMSNSTPEKTESSKSESQQNNLENSEHVEDQMPNLIPEKTEGPQSPKASQNSDSSLNDNKQEENTETRANTKQSEMPELLPNSENVSNGNSQESETTKDNKEKQISKDQEQSKMESESQVLKDLLPNDQEGAASELQPVKVYKFGGSELYESANQNTFSTEVGDVKSSKERISMFIIGEKSENPILTSKKDEENLEKFKYEHVQDEKNSNSHETDTAPFSEDFGKEKSSEEEDNVDDILNILMEKGILLSKEEEEQESTKSAKKENEPNLLPHKSETLVKNSDVKVIPQASEIQEKIISTSAKDNESIKQGTIPELLPLTKTQYRKEKGDQKNHKDNEPNLLPNSSKSESSKKKKVNKFKDLNAKSTNTKPEKEFSSDIQVTDNSQTVIQNTAPNENKTSNSFKNEDMQGSASDIINAFSNHYPILHSQNQLIDQSTKSVSVNSLPALISLPGVALYFNRMIVEEKLPAIGVSLHLNKNVIGNLPCGEQLINQHELATSASNTVIEKAPEVLYPEQQQISQNNENSDYYQQQDTTHNSQVSYADHPVAIEESQSHQLPPSDGEALLAIPTVVNDNIESPTPNVFNTQSGMYENQDIENSQHCDDSKTAENLSDAVVINYSAQPTVKHQELQIEQPLVQPDDYNQNKPTTISEIPSKCPCPYCSAPNTDSSDDNLKALYPVERSQYSSTQYNDNYEEQSERTSYQSGHIENHKEPSEFHLNSESIQSAIPMQVSYPETMRNDEISQPQQMKLLIEDSISQEQYHQSSHSHSSEIYQTQEQPSFIPKFDPLIPKYKLKLLLNEILTKKMSKDLPNLHNTAEHLKLLHSNDLEMGGSEMHATIEYPPEQNEFTTEIPHDDKLEISMTSTTESSSTKVSETSEIATKLQDSSQEEMMIVSTTQSTPIKQTNFETQISTVEQNNEIQKIQEPETAASNLMENFMKSATAIKPGTKLNSIDLNEQEKPKEKHLKSFKLDHLNISKLQNGNSTNKKFAEATSDGQNTEISKEISMQVQHYITPLNTKDEQKNHDNSKLVQSSTISGNTEANEQQPNEAESQIHLKSLKLSNSIETHDDKISLPSNNDEISFENHKHSSEKSLINIKENEDESSESSETIGESSVEKHTDDDLQDTSDAFARELHAILEEIVNNYLIEREQLQNKTKNPNLGELSDSFPISSEKETLKSKETMKSKRESKKQEHNYLNSKKFSNADVNDSGKKLKDVETSTSNIINRYLLPYSASAHAENPLFMHQYDTENHNDDEQIQSVPNNSKQNYIGLLQEFLSEHKNKNILNYDSFIQDENILSRVFEEFLAREEMRKKLPLSSNGVNNFLNDLIKMSKKSKKSSMNTENVQELSELESVPNYDDFINPNIPDFDRSNDETSIESSVPEHIKRITLHMNSEPNSETERIHNSKSIDNEGCSSETHQLETNPPSFIQPSLETFKFNDEYLTNVQPLKSQIFLPNPVQRYDDGGVNDDDSTEINPFSQTENSFYQHHNEHHVTPDSASLPQSLFDSQDQFDNLRNRREQIPISSWMENYDAPPIPYKPNPSRILFKRSIDKKYESKKLKSSAVKVAKRKADELEYDKFIIVNQNEQNQFWGSLFDGVNNYYYPHENLMIPQNGFVTSKKDTKISKETSHNSNQNKYSSETEVLNIVPIIEYDNAHLMENSNSDESLNQKQKSSSSISKEDVQNLNLKNSNESNEKSAGINSTENNSSEPLESVSKEN